MKNKIIRSDSRSDYLDVLVKHLEAQKNGTANQFSPFTPVTNNTSNVITAKGESMPCMITGGIVISDTNTQPKETYNEAF